MGPLRLLASTWRARGGALIVLLAALGSCGNQLTNHLGYASALVAAVVASAIACFVLAALPARLERAGVRDAGAGSLALAGGLYGAGLVALYALVVAVHGLFAEQCTPGRGAVFFLLIALPGAVLAPLCGLLIGARLRHRPRLAGALAGLVVPATIVWSIARFAASPAIFAYDPFFGFYPGALYDETIPLSATLVTYRLGTLGAIVAAAGLLHWAWDGARNALDVRAALRAARARAPALGAALAGAAVMLGIYLAGPALGHRESAADIARALGGRIESRRCVVLYARSIEGREARLTARDCDVRVEQLEAFFGVRVPERITVYLFADAAQKQALMGAADTYIAKPWRREVYLQYAPFPHPVLKHELAHVVAGQMGRWPFYVSSRWAVVPLPGLIEGAAVAAAWEDEGDTTPHQWSRAMLEAGLAPRVEVLTGLGFFTHASGTAYTAAGSFSRWLVERHGAARFRAVYRDGDFPRAYGRPLRELEREWHAFLRTVDVPERVLSRARTRFRRAGLLARVCPHETAELYDHAAIRLAAGEVARARGELERVVANDPTDVQARTSLAEAYTREGNVARAVQSMERATRDLGPAAGARLRARIADVVWRWQGPDAAREIYRPVDVELFDEDEARTLEVKRWALGLLAGAAPDPAYTVAVQDLLIGRGPIGPDAVSSVARLALELRTGARGAPPDAAAGYLVARQVIARERWADGAALLASIDPSALPTDRVRAEARRLEALARYLAGERERAMAIFDALARDPARPQGARDTAADWVDRIRREGR